MTTRRDFEKYFIGCHGNWVCFLVPCDSKVTERRRKNVSLKAYS
jgi:hypothetical protein